MYNLKSKVGISNFELKPMKKLVFTGLLLVSLSCVDDNGGGSDCLSASDLKANGLESKSSSTVGNEDLVLEYLDVDGHNLIANNAYSPVDVSLEYENGIRTEVVDLQNEETKYMVWVVGFQNGKNTISVTLSPSEIDEMLLYATEVDFSSCSGPSFAIDSVFYNGEKQLLKTVSPWLKKVSIVK